ncbi:hypothetical protein [Baekduia sp. Peel2402]|uniref:hypothetical protein n=1 Tax=Baekduia sp. Peel2402 TaxID=3458296 RepID=UPI00403ECBD7
MADLPIGRALVEAVARVRCGEEPQAQTVAFAVACAVRDGAEGATEALTGLLGAVAAGSDVPSGTLVNTLTAVQFAAMPASETFAGWTPPAKALAGVVERALERDVMLQEQVDDLLGTLVHRALVATWLGEPLRPAIARRIELLS